MTRRNNSLRPISGKIYVQRACHVTKYDATFGIDKDEHSKKVIAQNASSLTKSKDVIATLLGGMF